MDYREKFQDFYNSTNWRKLRNTKFADADGLCESCRARGIIKEGKEVHHIIPIEKDMSKALDYDNLKLLCSDCHNKAHGRESPLQKFNDFWEGLK